MEYVAFVIVCPKYMPSSPSSNPVTTVHQASGWGSGGSANMNSILCAYYGHGADYATIKVSRSCGEQQAYDCVFHYGDAWLTIEESGLLIGAIALVWSVAYLFKRAIRAFGHH